MIDKQDPITHAARLLREAAQELRQAHTLSSDRNNWIGEPEAKAAYDEHMAAAQALEDWEAAVGAGGVSGPLMGRASISANAGEPRKVFLVATGEEHEGEATYTRYDDKPPPLCDSECLFAAPPTALSAAPAVLSDEAILNRTGCIDYSPGTAEYDLELIRWYRTQIASPAPQQSRPLSHPNREFPGLAQGAAIASESGTPPTEQQATKETSGGVNGWRDISTAPKDGSRFVATGHNYGLYSEVRHTCVAQWFRGCWMEASDWNETSELKYLTHWMPLPSPPDDVAAPAEQQAAPKAAPGEPGQDSTPHLSVGDSSFEGWYESYCPAHKADKQRARDAYAAGMGDPLVRAAPQREAQEPTTIDQKTMELAESVGLIGPASRIGDLHAAIQRFHDLICVNATIKAAVMAADVISGVATPARDYPPLPMQFACSGVFPVYSADQMRAYVDADRAAYAPGSSQPAPAPLSDDAKDVVQDAAFEAVRKKLCALPRFSFLSDGYGVRRVPDKSGSWIAFDAAHALFDPVAVDAARKQGVNHD